MKREQQADVGSKVLLPAVDVDCKEKGSVASKVALPAEGSLDRLRQSISEELVEVREKGDAAARKASWLQHAFAHGQVAALEDVLDAIEYLITEGSPAGNAQNHGSPTHDGGPHQP